MVTIYGSDGTVKIQAPCDDNSTQEHELQGDNVLTLSFTLYEHVALEVNDYAEFRGQKYWLMERYRPEQKSTVEWRYDMKLYGIESLIKRFLVLNDTDGDDEPVFTLTAPPREHVALIVKSINNGMNRTTDWKVGTVEGTDNIVIDYEGKYCDEALREVAEKAGNRAEWWVEGQTVNVCRCETGEEVTLGYNKGLTGISCDMADNAKFYTRLYPVGSSRNIDPEKYGHSRLQLPGGVKHVDVNVEKYGVWHHYEADAFLDIYPKRIGTVSSVRSEEVTDEVHFADFGRRAILNLRQTLASKILELQKDSLYAKYKDKIGHIIAAEVYQVWKKEILLLDDDGNELLLPKSEQIPTDFYRKGETVRAIVQRVDNYNNNPKILLSRTDKVFLQRLFELEVPEINDGLITIKAIARIPGERAKVAVESYDDRIDPVGACVGMKGSRIHGIVRELRNENIDVINYTSNLSLFIQRALSPAKISSIRVNEEEKRAEVYLRPEEVSLAIGKGGLNIKLACMLTEYTIDVFRDIEGADEEDIYLDEFSDEIDSWVIDALKNIGCYTAKSVLAMDRNEIIERADLEEQTVDDLLAILSAEFEDEGNE